MKNVLTALGICMLATFCANAQIQVDTMHLASDWYTSYYPLFKSTTNPAAADAANKALQLSDQNKIFTPANVKAWTDFCSQHDQKICWAFQSKTVNVNFLAVRIIRQAWGTGSLRGSPIVDVANYFFNPSTGDLLNIEDFITVDGMQQFKAIVTEALLKAQPDLDCKDHLMTAWDGGYVFFYPDPATESFIFEATCFPEGIFDEQPIKASVKWKTMDNLLQPYFYEMVKPGKALTPDGIAHLWAGVIGENIHVTLLLRKGEKEIDGVEAYNKYGIPIPLRVVQSGNHYTISELDGAGKIIGTFEVALANRKLSGTWSNGTKTLKFRAGVGGEK